MLRTRLKSRRAKMRRNGSGVGESGHYAGGVVMQRTHNLDVFSLSWVCIEDRLICMCVFDKPYLGLALMGSGWEMISRRLLRGTKVYIIRFFGYRGEIYTC